jgi:hypothetical protein
MAVMQASGRLAEARDFTDRISKDRRGDRAAEWTILLTVAAVAGMEAALLAWLVL